MKRFLSLLLSLVLVLALLAGCDTVTDTTPATTGTTASSASAAGRTILDPAIDQELFGGSGSYETLLSGVQAALASGAFSNTGMYKTMTGTPTRNGTSDTAAGTASAAESQSAYSTTNVQVAGVDEADIVKTDGRYLYYVANGRLYVLDAAEAKPQVIYTWTFKRNAVDGKKTTNETPVEIYLDPVGKRLTVIIQGYQYEAVPLPTGTVGPKPAETKPAETKPVETKPAASASAGTLVVPPVAPDQASADASAKAAGTATAANAVTAPAIIATGGAETPSPAVDLPASGVSADTKIGSSPAYYPMNQKTYVITRVYSVADPKTPRLLRTFSQEGSYLSSRLVDNTAFILTNKYEYRLYQTGAAAVGGSIAYDVGVGEEARNTASSSAGSSGTGSAGAGSTGGTNSAGSTSSGETASSAGSVSGSGSTGSISTDETKTTTTTAAKPIDPKLFKDILPKVSDDPDKDVWETLPADRIGIVPNSDPSAQLIISAIPVANDSLKPTTISLLGASGIVYASMDSIYIANYAYNYNAKKPEDSQSSMKIYRLSIAGGKVAANGTGTVPGTAINQFAMDENNGYFRIATTLASFVRTPTQTQNQSESTVYVLDKSLKVVGQVGKLGPGENIRSVRFMGDRAYVVTFRTTDPLYVLDLKTPTAPKVLGELKIPGFSTYLHPYGENMLIGFGYDAVVEGSNAYQTGIKVSLFDVADVSKPKELSTLVLGGRGSYSALDSSHKALLFSQEKNLIAFPATLNTMSGNDKMSYRSLFQGIIVLAIDNGKLVLRGGLTNAPNLTNLRGSGLAYDKMTPADNQAFSGYDSIQRAVMLGDRIVTLSARLVRQYGLDNLKQVGEAALTGYQDFYGVGSGIREAMPAIK